MENSTATFEYDVPCLRSFTQRFYDITAQYPFLVWEENGRILGYAYASAPYSRAAFSWCAEPSIYLRPEARGKGIGRNIIQTLEKDEFFLRSSRIEIPSSITAVEFYRKMGYDYKNGIKEPDGEQTYRLEKFR